MRTYSSSRLLAAGSSCLLVLFGLAAFPAQAAIPLEDALEQKPVLSTLLGNDARLTEVAEILGWSAEERALLAELVLEEKHLMRELQTDSGILLRDLRLSPEAREVSLKELGYDQRLANLALRSRQGLLELLDASEEQIFLSWARARWEADSRAGGLVATQRLAGATALTYKVYATQYDAYTTNEVAVPDRYVKFAAQGTQYSAGYPSSLNYSVTLERSSYTYTVRVYEVGPWNLDDNYWNSPTDPDRPRRMFTDLPQGKPEAQAAYYDGYNNGKDQSGRTVGNPAGVDLALEVAPRIGLGYLENDWVYVTYLWEDGSSEPPPTTGNLIGYVREGDISSGEAIAGATVTLSSGATATSDSTGLYRFTAIPAATYTVTASADCYYTASTSKTMTAGIDNWASLALTPDSSCGSDGGSCLMSPALPQARVLMASTSPPQGLPLGSAGFTLMMGVSALLWQRRRR